MITLDNDEHIILEVRKHWFALFADTLFLWLFLLLPIILAAAGKMTGIARFIAIKGDTMSLFIFLSSAWLLLIWIVFFSIWTNYYLDILIITNKRVLDIDQKGLFSREISTFGLDRIQDVTTEVYGIIATFLDFGNIHIQTAGEGRDFAAKSVPHPSDIRQQIMRAQENAAREAANP